MPTVHMKLTRAERKAGVDLRDVINGPSIEFLTVDTITDERIRDLRKAIDRETGGKAGQEWVDGREIMYTCMVALGLRASREKGGKRKARARCAEIINARASRKPKPKKPTPAPEGFSTYFGDVTIRRNDGQVTATFKMATNVPLDETESTAEEALNTLCDTLDSIAAQMRENAREWLACEAQKGAK